MKALSGHGVNVGHVPKRISHDFGSGGAGVAHAAAAAPAPPATSMHAGHHSISSIPVPPPHSNGVAPSVTGGSARSALSARSHDDGGGRLGGLVSPTLGSPTKSIPTLPSTHGATPPSTGASPVDELDKFERAFPSLDNFGKQFGETDLPVVTGSSKPRQASPSGPRPAPGSRSNNNLADILSFPSLPSVPMDIPGKSSAAEAAVDLPPPPPRPALDSLESAPSPPSPDLLNDLKRPASTPMFGDAGLSISPPEASPTDLEARFGALRVGEKHTSPVAAAAAGVSPPARSLQPGPSGSDAAPRALATSPPTQKPAVVPPPHPSTASGALTFPMAAPAPPPPYGMPTKSSLPDFAFTNSITPETLRTYFLNLSVDVLLLDVRAEKDHDVGYVGAEYIDRGCKINTVWIDPTVIMRPG